MNFEPINLEAKFARFSDHWSPRVVAELNDYQFKLVKAEGAFVWHSHQETDEAFIVVEGTLEIEFREGTVTLNAGELFVVPKGVEHRPIALGECKILLLEPRNVVNTGNAGGELTAKNDVWI
jgi:mannose-6-phosphate isomerase-like protein (cupin superfamily)